MISFLWLVLMDSNAEPGIDNRPILALYSVVYFARLKVKIGLYLKQILAVIRSASSFFSKLTERAIKRNLSK